VKLSATILALVINDVSISQRSRLASLDLDRSSSPPRTLDDTVATAAMRRPQERAGAGPIMSRPTSRGYWRAILTALPDLVNLIGNAIKFTEKGEVVAIRGSCIADRKGGVPSLRRSWTPEIGIPFDSAAKALQSVTQADTSTTRKYGGTDWAGNLRSTVQADGWREFGWIVRSDRQHVSLHYPPRPGSLPRGAADSYRARSVHGLRSLIVDDTKQTAGFCQEMLTNCGHEADRGSGWPGGNRRPGAARATGPLRTGSAGSMIAQMMDGLP